MKHLKNLSFQGKMITGFSVIIFGVLAVFGVALYSLNHILESKEKLDQTQSLARELTQLRSDQNYINGLLLSVVLSDNETEHIKLINDFEETWQQINQRLSSIKENQNANQAFIDKFQQLIQLKSNAYVNQMQQLELAKNNEIDAAHELYNNRVQLEWRKMRDLLFDLENLLDQQAIVLLEQSSNLVSRSYVTLSVLGFFIISIVLIIIIGSLRMITRIAREIKEGVSVVGTSTSEIQTTVAEISTGAAETATAISETTTTVEEIRQTTMVAGSKAKNLLASSQKASEVGEQGLESSQLMLDAMEKIDLQMKNIHNTITKLSDQNRSIGEITSTVADIADQSNLLAVNAAIEAAKAGEHGRGFSVVAQEIRNLAEQSKKSTAQVKEILNEIQKSVSQAVEVINQGTVTVEEGSRIVAEDRAVVELLIDNINEAVEAAVQISSSSQQQMAGMDQIVPAMENIKQASEQNVAGISQTQDAANSLDDLGQNLRKIIERYRI